MGTGKGVSGAQSSYAMHNHGSPGSHSAASYQSTSGSSGHSHDCCQHGNSSKEFETEKKPGQSAANSQRTFSQSATANSVSSKKSQEFNLMSETKQTTNLNLVNKNKLSHIMIHPKGKEV